MTVPERGQQLAVALDVHPEQAREHDSRERRVRDDEDRAVRVLGDDVGEGLASAVDGVDASLGSGQR